MRSPGRLLGAIALLAALSAQAELRGTLHEPRAGAVLRGGTTATVSWSPDGTLPAFIEEWEAFLSADGGEYYAYRITPHLDLDRRSFTFEVPNVETRNARILIRAGDERRELELELPQTFAIEQDHARALTEGHAELLEEERGEAAREGDRGVVAWLDGDREGNHLQAHSALQHEAALTAAESIHAPHTGPAEEDARFFMVPRAGWSAGIVHGVLTSVHLEPRHRSGRDVLLTGRRLNI